MKLPRTWGPFFSKFNTLTDIQGKAIPSILSGKDILISSPTASGKTEAVCAPLIERYIKRGEPWIILYVVPTRALINDLYNRLHNPCHQIGIKIEKRTGEYKFSLRSRQPNIILTTPESFDSMICRARVDGGHIFHNIVAVVLDEIHLLDGTARGEQVRWLLARLKRMLDYAKRNGMTHNDSLQVVALSATISNNEHITSQYLNDGTVISTKGQRDILVLGDPWNKKSIERSIIDHIKTDNPQKILVFSNSRKRVDERLKKMRNILDLFGYEAYAHHGSLSKIIREKAEKRMKKSEKCVLFATTTLEIGIDIGSIDLVVLDEPAFNISGLLQRIGRGNRRSNITKVLPCTSSDLGALIHESMIHAARDGWMGTSSYGPQHGVAIQQIMSYIFQSPSRKRQRHTLKSLIDSCSTGMTKDYILDHLISTSQLVEKEDGIRLSSDWLEKTEYGKIHVTIEDSSGKSIINRRTGEKIAKDVEYTPGKYFELAGKEYETIRDGPYDIEVNEERIDANDAEIKYRFKKIFTGADQPQSVKRYLGIPDDIIPVLSTNYGHFIFHFGGTRRKNVLKLALDDNNFNKNEYKINEWYVKIPKNSSVPIPWIEEANILSIQRKVENNIFSLEKKLARPYINESLPDASRKEDVLGWLQLSKEIHYMRSSEYIGYNDEEQEKYLKIIINDSKY